MNFTICLVMLFFSSCLLADYIATSEFTGTVCTGIGVEICSKVKIVAIGKNGELYEIKKTWKSVDEHNANTCHIKTKFDKAGPFSGLISSYKFPDFYTYKNNEYEKVSIDYLTFKCRKT